MNLPHHEESVMDWVVLMLAEFFEVDWQSDSSWPTFLKTACNSWYRSRHDYELRAASVFPEVAFASNCLCRLDGHWYS
jgi:hypothetical protein